MVWSGQESALKSDVTGRSSHQSDEMIVFLRASGIQSDITNQLRVSLASSVKAYRLYKTTTHTERDLDVLVLEITIDGFWASNNLEIIKSEKKFTLQLLPFFLKNSASKQALVLESSPPMTTRPSSLRDSQCNNELLNSSSVSILCLPEPKSQEL
jgi:hypothetical protein